MREPRLASCAARIRESCLLRDWLHDCQLGLLYFSMGTSCFLKPFLSSFVLCAQEVQPLFWVNGGFGQAVLVVYIFLCHGSFYVMAYVAAVFCVFSFLHHLRFTTCNSS